MANFICAFTATGKSTLAKKYKNVIDMESTRYKYLNCSGGEQTKATSRVENPNYPRNYFRAIEKQMNKNSYILVSDEIVYPWFRKKNITYWQVYPNKELKNEYYNRCITRGNNKQFADWLMENWEEWIDACKNDKYASKHVELLSGQYLENVLPNLILK